MAFGETEQPVVDEIEALAASAARFVRALRPDGMSAGAARKIVDHAIAIEKSIAAVKLLLADVAAAASGRGAAADLAKRSGTSKRKAQSLLDAAKNVKTQPALENALRDGQLSSDQAELIADAAAVNPGAAQQLIAKAKTESLIGLKDACGRARAAADPDEDATQRRLRRQRCFRMGTDTEGAFSFGGRGPKVDGTELLSFLQPFRDQIFNANRTAGVHDPSEAMDYDALMAMAHAAYTTTTHPDEDSPASDAGGDPGGNDGGRGPVKVKGPKQVNVVVNWDALMGRYDPDEDTAYVAGLGAVPVSLIADILDDAFLTVAVMKSNEVTKIKRIGRHIPAELHDALMIRYRYRCATPGCTNWIRLERDHTIPYRNGGETSYTNLKPLCDPCHDDKTAADRQTYGNRGPSPPDGQLFDDSG